MLRCFKSSAADFSLLEIAKGYAEKHCLSDKLKLKEIAKNLYKVFIIHCFISPDFVTF